MGKTGYKSGIEWELNELVFCNLRCLSCYLGNKTIYVSASSMFPYLQTLVLYSSQRVEVPIWNMLQLRHVKVETLHLPDPGEGKKSDVVLEDLQTMSRVQNLRCIEKVLQRIPSVKKLGICYELKQRDWQSYCFNNLVHLRKLEALKCIFVESTPPYLDNLIFPPTLRKLTLEGCHLPWKDLAIVGSLPNLEVLKLKTQAFKGQEWKPNEGEFLSLKYLLLMKLNLEHWIADTIHFPKLQHLIINCCLYLDKIPGGIGEIPTLGLLELHDCNGSLIASPKEIQQEQWDLGNDSVQVHITGRQSMEEDK